MSDMETTGFLAKYEGKCLTCGLAIHPGHDHIVSIHGTKFCYRHTDCTAAHLNAEVRRFVEMGWSYRRYDEMIVGEIRSGRMSYEHSVHCVQHFLSLTEQAA
jgi:hypothetical protein